TPARAARLRRRPARAFDSGLREPLVGGLETALELLDRRLRDLADARAPVQLGIHLRVRQPGPARELARDGGVVVTEVALLLAAGPSPRGGVAPAREWRAAGAGA